MNDTFGKIISPAPPSGGGRFGGKGQTVQILKLPNDIGNLAKSLRLDGQITSLRADNTATIQTSAGDIEVQVKANSTRQPQVGQKVEIEIPAQSQRTASAQPVQAIIRNAPARNSNAGVTNKPNNTPTPPDSAKIQATYSRPAQANFQSQGVSPPTNNTGIPPQTAGAGTTQTQPPPAQNTQNNTAQNIVQNVQTNINQSALNRTALPPLLKETTSQPNILTNNTNARPLLINSVVRLLPTPPAQAQNITAQFIQTLPQPVQSLITQTAFTADLTAQNIQHNLPQQLIANVQVPSPQFNVTSPPSLLNNNIQVTAQPVQNTAVITPPQNAQTQIITASFPDTILLAQTIPSAQTFPPQIADRIIPQPNVATAQASLNTTPQAPQNIIQTRNITAAPAPIVTSASLAQPLNTPPLISGQLDVQITQITSPPSLITAPSATPTPVIPAVPQVTPVPPPFLNNVSAPALTAQVTGFTPQNLPLVSLQLPGARIPQSFILQSATSNLQLGSQIQIIPKTNVAAQMITSSAPLSPRLPLNPLLQGFQWSAMDELLSSLRQISPQAAASLARALPNAGNPTQLAPAAMMIAAAIRSGDIASWLGDKKMDLLRQTGKSDLIGRLSQNAGAAPRAPTAESAPSGDWRAVPLPMFWEGAIHKITLYTRQESGNKQKKDNENNSTRFIFDLSLSRMGDIQLDGLLRGDRLDLILRTPNAFSLPMQQTMRQAYTGALESTKLTGDITFQGSMQNWVHVLENKEQLGVHV